MLDVFWKMILAVAGFALTLGGAIGLYGWFTGQRVRMPDIFGVVIPNDSLALGLLMVGIGVFMIGLLWVIAARR